MLVPIDVRFRSIRPSPAIQAIARERANNLERFHPRISSCRVMVEAAHQQHMKGSVYRVRLDITVPGREIVASSELPPHSAYGDVFVALHRAFDEARRELQDDLRRRRGYVKTRQAG
jgi:hypothetical protein